MDLYTVRNAVSTTLDTISGLRCYWFHPSRPDPPFVLVKPEAANLEDALASGGLSTITLTLIVCVIDAEAAEEGSQKSLDAYLSTAGSSSIPLTLYNSPTLSQSGLSAVARSWQNYGRVVLEDGTHWLGAEVTVEVMSA